MTTPLRQAREQRNLTIQQVAAAVGIDSGNLSRIERGLQVPTKDLTEKLARFFDNEVTETQIIYPERSSGLPTTSQPTADRPAVTAVPDRRAVIPRNRRKQNGV